MNHNFIPSQLNNGKYTAEVKDKLMPAKNTRKISPLAASRNPHVVVLPKNADLNFSIVKQGRVLITTTDNKTKQKSRTIRSAEPFVISTTVNGVAKQFESKLQG